MQDSSNTGGKDESQRDNNHDVQLPNAGLKLRTEGKMFKLVAGGYDLVDVDFLKADTVFPFPTQDICDIFPERILRTRDDGMWIGVLCSVAEWEKFMAMTGESLVEYAGQPGFEEVVQRYNRFQLEWAMFRWMCRHSAFKGLSDNERLSD